ncbi:hypothetical protein TcasGA2_TC010762 [Tribolium castaneum]|uniref:Uncharacterized protein n=1 Tax=Tribolium castaneum TaxID=7070 RepID=D6W7U1_TRICA|nr:hypothetical protein TcasGA2_TC010762 [Tribolium castaneum]
MKLLIRTAQLYAKFFNRGAKSGGLEHNEYIMYRQIIIVVMMLVIYYRHKPCLHIHSNKNLCPPEGKAIISKLETAYTYYCCQRQSKTLEKLKLEISLARLINHLYVSYSRLNTPCYI